MNKLTTINSSDSKLLVFAKATYYPDAVRVFIPNKPYLRSKEGFEHSKTKSNPNIEDIDSEYETNEERSIRRTRKTIKDYVLCNDFNLFCTFTIGKDRYNDDRSIQRLKTWFKNQRDRNGKFRYIVVTERHKDGALHFHALIGGYTGKLKYAINPNNGEYISDKRNDFVRNFVEYKLGNNTAKVIDSKESSTKTAYYLQKYIGKDLTASFGKNRYWASKGLNKPETEDNPELFYKQVETPLHWVIDHGTILEFEYGLHPITDSFIEAHRL
ncbi:MAG: hypothetical protein V4611_04565 [Patescibacteria group bacterium]